MVNFEPHAVCDHAHPFIMTVYPSSNGYFQQENGLSGILSILHSLHISIQSSTLEMWGNGQKEKKEKRLHELHDSFMPVRTKISEECFQNLAESMPQRIYAALKAKRGLKLKNNHV